MLLRKHIMITETEPNVSKAKLFPYPFEGTSSKAYNVIVREIPYITMEVLKMMINNYMRRVAQEFVATFTRFGERKVYSHCVSRY